MNAQLLILQKPCYDKPSGTMKDSFDLISYIYTRSLGYHTRLKKFIKAPSYGQLLFHKKGNINETILELILIVRQNSNENNQDSQGKPGEMITDTEKLAFIIITQITKNCALERLLLNF
jgi:hypothetical protein